MTKKKSTGIFGGFCNLLRNDGEGQDDFEQIAVDLQFSSFLLGVPRDFSLGKMFDLACILFESMLDLRSHSSVEKIVEDFVARLGVKPRLNHPACCNHRC